jgi:tetratricopeptide (TPR) repeat protein
MTMLSILRPKSLLVSCLCLVACMTAAQENRTVIGPRNVALADGANALLADDAEEGVRLTLLGLEQEVNASERLIGLNNLCAGYLMLKQLDAALSYCNQVLEKDDRHWRAYSNRALVYIMLQRYEDAEPDLQQAEALAPDDRLVKVVRSMLLDATNPVAPEIIIEERRQPATEEQRE